MGKKINWIYCECGCHAHEFHLGEIYYSWYQELDSNSNYDATHYLFKGPRGYSNPILIEKDLNFFRKKSEEIIKEEIQKKFNSMKEYIE